LYNICLAGMFPVNIPSCELDVCGLMLDRNRGFLFITITRLALWLAMSPIQFYDQIGSEAGHVSLQLVPPYRARHKIV
jgi:hypothetical protein